MANGPSSSLRTPPDEGRWYRLSKTILRGRAWILAVSAALTLLLGFQLTRLRLEWNEQAEFAASDAEYTAFETFRERFGGEENLVITLESEDLFTAEALEYLRDLTEELREIPRAVGVASLATVPTLRGDARTPRIEPFLLELPETREDSERLRAEAIANPMWAGTLVSSDGKTACINLLLPAMNTDGAARVEIVNAVDALLRRLARPGIAYSYTGVSPLARDMLVTLTRDFRLLLWLTPLLILVFLSLAFRTWRGVLLPAMVIAVSVIWTLGLMSVFGNALNYATVMLPTLLSVVGLSYVIHFLSAYHDACGGRADHAEIVARTLSHMIPACFMAAFTTAIGFGTMLVSDLRSIRELGVYAALGVMLAFLLCVTVVPALLSLLPMPAKAASRHRSVRQLRQILFRIARVVNRDTWKVPLGVGALALLSAVGIARIRVESQLFRHLPESAPSIRGLRAVEKSMAGIHSVEMMVDGPPGAFGEPWALAALDRLHRRVERIPRVDAVLSVNSLYREIHRYRNPSAADAQDLPATAAQISEYRLLFSMAGQDRLLNALVTPDGRAARLTARIPTLSTADHQKIFRAIESGAADDLGDRLTLRTTGFLKLVSTKLQAMVRSLTDSFGLTLLLIAVLVSVQLRSVRAGLLGMIPNVLPVVMGMGLMGFLGIPLSGGTVMIPAIGLGITVDHTIHFLLWYGREGAPGRSTATRVQRTLLAVGRAMTYASVMLAAGFAILLFSSYNLSREFGLVTAFIMLAALLCDLCVTPYLARVFRLLQREKS